MTDRWKQRVRDVLAANNGSDPPKFPKNQSQLVKAIGALHGTRPPDRTAITKLWKADASSLVDDICTVLGIEPPMMEISPEPEVVTMVRNLPEDKQHDVLDFINRFLLPPRS